MTALDLHTHSTVSDGLVPPEDLVRMAARRGLAGLALTDHDTTGGIDRAAKALPPGMTLVPGAEISCRVEISDGYISTHVLAYLFDPAEPEFAAVRAQLRQDRTTRARTMVGKLAADGHPVRWKRVLELAAGTVGRPHVAAAMVEAGLVPDVAGAFTREWIGKGGRYWVGQDKPDVLEALRLIRAAGGVSVFAHPFASKRGVTVGPEVIEAMARAGLSGIEVDHPDQPPAARAQLRDVADNLGLLTIGGSDFHGDSKPQGIGAETTSWEVYEQLVSAARGASPITRARQAVSTGRQRERGIIRAGSGRLMVDEPERLRLPAERPAPTTPGG